MKREVSAARVEGLQQKHMEQVVSLLQALSSYQPLKDSYADIWESFAAQPNVHAVVAIERGEVVGYGSVVIETKIRGGKMAHIEDIVIHPNYHRKGLGKMVILALYQIARINECYKLALQCQPHNINFYQKCGYETSGVAMQRFIYE